MFQTIGNGHNKGYDDYNYYNEQIAHKDWVQQKKETTAAIIEALSDKKEEPVKKEGDDEYIQSIPAC